MSYGTLAGWRAYALARGDRKPTDASDEDAAAALVRASDYIKYKYVTRFKDGCDENSEGVEPATYIAAGLELGSPGFLSKTYTPSQQKILTKAGDIEWTVANNVSASDAASPRSTLIENILASCLPDELTDTTGTADDGSVSARLMSLGS